MNEISEKSPPQARAPAGADARGEPSVVNFSVTTRNGTVCAVEASGRCSLMEVIRARGFDEPFAVCGGCCSCATCHVYVDEAVASRLPPIADTEEDLLACLSARTAESRLSCQISVTAALEGANVRIAPEA